jgi:flagellar hook protein FlgE
VNVAFNPTGITAPATAFTVNFNNQGQLVQVGANTTPGSSGVFTVSGINFSAVLGTSPAATQLGTVDVNLGTLGGTGTTQLAAPYSVQTVSQDGLPPAALTGVGVDDNGFMTATYANGLSQQIYRLPVATFNNPDGLTREDGNAYSASLDSGAPSLKPANTGGSGQIAPSALENSTVDLSQEFTNMIMAQRAYNAASKVVTTADQLMTDTIQMKQ